MVGNRIEREGLGDFTRVYDNAVAVCRGREELDLGANERYLAAKIRCAEEVGNYKDVVHYGGALETIREIADEDVEDRLVWLVIGFLRPDLNRL